jgi:hypothetical protein
LRSAALLLAGLRVLPAMLAALPRILGLLAGLLLATLLAALVRVVLAGHHRYSLLAAPSPGKTHRGGSLFRELMHKRSHQSETFPQKWLKADLSRP